MDKKTDEEINQFLKDMLSFTVPREALTRPSPEFVIQVYSRFLEEFGIDTTRLHQPDIIACHSVMNMEYMNSIIYPIHVYKAIQKYVSKFANFEMTLQDILQPRRIRTNMILSILCQFYMKFLQVKNEWLTLEEKCKDNPQKINEYEQKNRDLKHQIEEKSMHLSSLKNKSIDLEKELSALNDQLKKKKKLSEERSEQSKQKKAEVISLRDKLCELDINISEGKEKKQKLSEMIVKSPQKSIQITTDMEKELDKLKKEVPIIKEQKLSCMKKLECQKAVFTSLKASNEDLGSLLMMLSETDNQCGDLEKIKQDAQNLREEIKNIEIKEKEVQVAKQTWQSKRNNTARHFNREHANLLELNNGLQTALKQKEEVSNGLQQKLANSQKQLERLRQENAQSDKLFESLHAQYSSKFNNVLSIYN